MKPSVFSGTSYSTRNPPTTDLVEGARHSPAAGHPQSPSPDGILDNTNGLSRGRPVSRRLHRKQSAVYIGVSLSWLDKSRLRGDGPAFLEIGGRVVYDTADLDAFMARCRRTSTSRPP